MTDQANLKTVQATNPSIKLEFMGQEVPLKINGVEPKTVLERDKGAYHFCVANVMKTKDGDTLHWRILKISQNVYNSSVIKGKTGVKFNLFPGAKQVEMLHDPVAYASKK